jgi:hypothetical protein
LENRAAKKYEMMSRKGISILCAGLRKKANFEKQIKDFRSCQYFCNFPKQKGHCVALLHAVKQAYSVFVAPL